MKRLMIIFLLMTGAGYFAAGQDGSRTAELGWLELPAFSEDPEHFFVSHYTEEYWGKHTQAVMDTYSVIKRFVNFCKRRCFQ